MNTLILLLILIITLVAGAYFLFVLSYNKIKKERNIAIGLLFIAVLVFFVSLVLLLTPLF